MHYIYINYIYTYRITAQYSTVQYPLTLLATVDDCSRVAVHVHWDTMVVAVSPMETFPPASKAVSRLSESW